ncbi:hypothetical protein L6164_002600 [Bauhinia variegata]|uniref:Uncharacterized protein n=1 Tax=Bauhinia variegata TaxID=167791 RepID=A0ACB9PYT9_BAUVA|nr:hypothetical protein L6164_002600 [Bauhinia variegata]
MQVFVLYITGHLNSKFSPEHQREYKRYIYNHQNEDGGWGLHIESHNSSMLCTIWLSILGVFDWRSTLPMPPEIWCLPSSFPVHPGKILCYTRLIYMPMSYLYGKRFVAPFTPQIVALREELLTEPYNEINWREIRHRCAKEDRYIPHHLWQELFWDTAYMFTEPLLTCWPLNKLVRKKALQVTMNLIHYEDENSRYLALGSVEKVLCMLACWVEDPDGDSFKRHLARVADYLWVAEDGMTLQALSSQVWDASFSTLALLASNLNEEIRPAIMKAHDFLKKCQVKENLSGDFKRMFRHINSKLYCRSAVYFFP